MVTIRKIILDVLKPHEPSILKVSSDIAVLGENYCVHVTAIELDKRTETLKVEVTGDNLDFDLITSVLTEMGASLHSIDEVIAINETQND